MHTPIMKTAYALGEVVVERDMRLLIGVAVLMVTVGLLAAAGPVRRGLQVQPTEALRADS